MKRRFKRVIALAMALAIGLSPTGNTSAMSYGASANYSEVSDSGIIDDENVIGDWTNNEEDSGASNNGISNQTENNQTENNQTESNQTENNQTENNKSEAEEPNTTQPTLEYSTESNTNNVSTTETTIELPAIDMVYEDAVSTEGFASLQACIDSINTDAVTTIVLSKDYTDASINIPEGKSLIIDLNGHIITPNKSLQYGIAVFGTLELIDSVGTGMLDGTGTTNTRGININARGKFILSGAKIANFHYSGTGAGIYVAGESSLVLNSGVVSNNTSDTYGGGIYVLNLNNLEINDPSQEEDPENNPGTPGVDPGEPGEDPEEPNKEPVITVEISNNTAAIDGGGIYVYSKDTNDTYSFHNLKISENTSKGATSDANGGGGMYINAPMKVEFLETVLIEGNKSAKHGGGIYVNLLKNDNGSIVDINKATIKGNTATANGGGIYFRNVVSTATYEPVKFNMIDGLITENLSETGYGGGVYLYRKSIINMTGGTISKNQAYTYGAGIYQDSENSNGNERSTFTLDGGTISGNKFTGNPSAEGAGYYTYRYATVNLKKGTIDGNMGAKNGGGVKTDNWCTVTISDGMKITNNQGTGGGIYVNDNVTLTMTGGLISGNGSFDGSASGGAGIRTGSATNNAITLIFSGGEICNNTAYSGNGGGLNISMPAIFKGDIKIHDNKILTGSSGGGLITSRRIEIRDNVEIYNNYAGSEGGGIYVDTNSNATLIMTGGSIHDNTSAGSGGGIRINGNGGSNKAHHLLKHGEIYNNKSGGNGAGIYFTANRDNETIAPTLELAGDIKIHDNTAAASKSGGGLYIDHGIRLLVHENAEITKNYATNGGGIYIQPTLSKATHNKQFDDGGSYSLEILGGTIKDNDAITGKDIYINRNKDGDYKLIEVYIAKASDMFNKSSDSKWYYEKDESYVDYDFDTVNGVDKAALVAGSTYYLTFAVGGENVAKIGTTMYSSVQKAIDAIKSGTKPQGSTIELLVDRREEVVFPEGVTATLDLAGFSLKGLGGSVITIEKNANVTVKDSSTDKTGKITDGRGQVAYEGTNRFGGGVFVKGTFTLDGATITECNSKYGSAVYVDNGAKFYMKNNSIITDNWQNTAKGLDSTAVYVCYSASLSSTAGAYFEMTNSKITNNKGRGVTAYNGQLSEIIITKSEISGNNASGNNEKSQFSGGVYAYYANKVVIKDSVITKNISAGRAAGMTLYGNPTDVSAGKGIYEITNTEITSNSTTTGDGSGIYLNGNADAILNLTGTTIITGNNNTVVGNKYGGGLSVVNGGVNIAKGVKIYGNSTQGLAKDIYIAKGKMFYGEGIYADEMKVDKVGCWYDSSKAVYYAKEIPADYDADTPDEDKDAIIEKLDSIFNKDASGNLLTTVNNDYYFTSYALPGTTGVAAIYVDDGNGGKEQKLFVTLAAAVAAASKPKYNTTGKVTIELLEDISESVIISDAEVEITLDMNGHSITAPDGAPTVFTFKDAGKLVIDNSKADSKTSYIKTLDDEDADITKTRAIYINSGECTVKKGVTIKDFQITVAAGQSGYGGAVYVYKGEGSGDTTKASKFVLDGGTITNCSAVRGGAIYMESADQPYFKQSLEIKKGVISYNKATTYGGAIYINSGNGNGHSSFIISGGEIAHNEAVENNGGAIYYEGANSAVKADTFEIYGVNIHDNVATLGQGGAIYMSRPGNYKEVDGEQQPAYIGKEGYETVIANNEAGTNGGGIRVENTSDTHPNYLVLSNVTIKNNIAYGIGNDQGGGGFRIDAGRVEMKNCVIDGNKAYLKYGGGYISATQFDLENNEFKNNQTVNGNAGAFAISSNETAPSDEMLRVISGGSFHNNTAGSLSSNVYGGAVQIVARKSLRFENVEFYENKVPIGHGGAIAFDANANDTVTERWQVEFKDCYIHDNNAVNGNGGAIGNNSISYADLILSGNTRITNNSANSGGGMYIGTYNHGSYTGDNDYRILHVILKDNVEISNNKARTGNGGGIYLSNANMTIQDNTLIKGNTAAGHSGGIYYELGISKNDAGIRYYSEINFNMLGGTIEGNTATHGGGIYQYNNSNMIKMNINYKGGEIKNNKTTSTSNGGGGVMIYSNNADHDVHVDIQGVKIHDNYSSYNGGGIYFGKNLDDIKISNSASIASNEAKNYGGGVFVQDSNSNFILDTKGQIYGNIAALGQDVYASKASTLLQLINPKDMFGETDKYVATEWINEKTNETYGAVRVTNLSDEYPLTLRYRMKGIIVAVYKGVAYESVQDAVYAAQFDDGSEPIVMVHNTEECVYIPGSTNISLNLNGYTIKGSGDSAITAKGNLTFYDEKAEDITIDDITYTTNKDESGNKITGIITGTAAVIGGGIYVDGGNVTMKSGQLSDCKAGSGKETEGYGGGAIGISSGTFTLEGGKICNNTARMGGAVLITTNTGKLVLKGGQIEDNIGTKHGGAIYNTSGSVLMDVGSTTVISGNTAQHGGAIYNKSGKVDILGGTVENNKASLKDSTDVKGGAIYIANGSVSLSDCLITGNKVEGVRDTSNDSGGVQKVAGGAIFVADGKLFINDGTLITGNSAARGGAILQNKGAITIAGGTITGNKADLGGGIAQNPFEKSTVNVNAGARVYGNKSQLTDTGNDFYSRCETLSDSDYRKTYDGKCPQLYMTPAVDMGLPAYNVWKSDSYTGDTLIGTNATNGQYINGVITKELNIEITASYLNLVNAESKLVTTGEIRSMMLLQESNGSWIDGIADGTANFDTIDNIGSGYFNARVTANQMLTKDPAHYSKLTAGYSEAIPYSYILYGTKEYKKSDPITVNMGTDEEPLSVTKTAGEWYDEWKSNPDNANYNRISWSDKTYMAKVTYSNEDTYFIAYDGKIYKKDELVPVTAGNLLRAGMAGFAADGSTYDDGQHYVKYNDNLYKDTDVLTIFKADDLYKKNSEVFKKVNYYPETIKDDATETVESVYIKDSSKYQIKYQPDEGDAKIYLPTDTIIELSTEKLAEDMIKNNVPGWSESTETYVYNGVTYKYITDGKKKYERTEMVEWSRGDDSGNSNSLVRSYDSVNYTLRFTLASTDTEADFGENVLKYKVKFRATVPYSLNEFEFVTDGSKLNITKNYEVPNASGGVNQVLEGYWEEETALAASTYTHNIGANIYGIPDGSIIQPVFESWVDGNETNEGNPSKATAKRVTVSSIPKYNVTVLKSKELEHTGYFDYLTGNEIAESDYKAMSSDRQENVVYGVLSGVGITFSMYNEPISKGMKGLEIPKGDIKFDLDLYNEIYCNGELKSKKIAPYIWGYKENETSTYVGKLPGNSYPTQNMNWNDVDDKHKTTHYAAGAAPLNSGGGNNACYSGGGWTIVQSEGDGTDISQVKTTVTIHGYQIDNTSQPNSPDLFNGLYVKPISAGYVQIITPFDDDMLRAEVGGDGSVEADTMVAVSGLKVTGASGKEPEPVRHINYKPEEEAQGAEKELTDLSAMNEYYQFKNAGGEYTPYALREEREDGRVIAWNEQLYADNTAKISVTKELASGEGNGDSIVKENYFTDAGLNRITVSVDEGETPLGSVVYAESYVTYTSGNYYTNDEALDPLHYIDPESPYFDSSKYSSSGLEFDYLTAINILQKFDADVFTPVGGEPVVDKRYNLKTGSNKIKAADGSDGAFAINIGETAVDWSDDATMSYTLTILYAAKPYEENEDGELVGGGNWNKKIMTDQYNQGIVSEPLTGILQPQTEYTDGGVADMDKYREENLIYFTTLKELYDYFGYDDDGNPKGKCIGILYEFRNCCIRSTRDISTFAKLNVTGDFNYTGNTYCTTNDVRAWTTFRPYYKMFYSNSSALNRLNEKSSSSPEKYSDYLYSFDWAEHEYDTQNGVQSYGWADTPLEDRVANDINWISAEREKQYTQGDVKRNPSKDAINIDSSEQKYDMVAYPNEFTPLHLEKDDYIKTQYRYGVKISGTNVNVNRGAAVLIYTLRTGITVNVTDTLANSTSLRTKYNLSSGERVANYVVTPSIEISSEAKKTELVSNGTQSTKIVIEIEIPEEMTRDADEKFNGLTYIDGSLEFDYSDKNCGYKQGDLLWEYDIADELNENGKRVIRAYTSVADINLKLPTINLACEIGNIRNDAKDVKNNDSLVITAKIYAAYEEYNICAASTKEDSKTISVIIDNKDGIYKSVDDRLVELGEDLNYSITYNNHNQKTATVYVADILPSSEDTRGSKFDGAYKVKGIEIHFNNKASYDNFISSGEKSIAYKIGSKTEINDSKRTTILKNYANDRQGSEIKNGTIPLEYESFEAERKVVIKLPDEDLIQYADGEKNIVLLAYFNEISGTDLAGEAGGVATIDVTLTPIKEDGSGGYEFLMDEAGKNHQRSENVYTNQNFYCKMANDSELGGGISHASQMSDDNMLESNKVSIVTVNRVISGTVFMDTNQDGQYTSKATFDAFPKDDIRRNTLVVEYPLKDIDVTLYEVKYDEDGKETGRVRAKDTLGNEYSVVKTDESGNYKFENLGEGTYVVVFEDTNNDYRYMTDNKTTVNQPLPFNRLSVTNLGAKLIPLGNKSVSKYSKTDSTFLESAELYKYLTMPTKTEIEARPYYSPNWDLGLYYYDLTLEKDWKNMIQGVEDGINITFNLTGTVPGEDDKDEVIYNGRCKMIKSGEKLTDVTGTYKYWYKGTEEPENAADVKITAAQDKIDTNMYTWKLDRMYVQAETEAGPIEYHLNETNICDVNGSPITSFFTIREKIDVDGKTAAITDKLVNTQILGSVTIVKVTGNGDILEGAEFSIYQEAAVPSDLDSMFIGYNDRIKMVSEGLGKAELPELEELNDSGNSNKAYKTGVTKKVYKVPIGNEKNLKKLIDAGEYDEVSNTVMVGTSFYIVHQELVDEETNYFYYLDVDPSKPLSYEIATIVVFDKLPLYNGNGKLYYTVRETGVPEGYLSLANFNILTGMDLFDGYKREVIDAETGDTTNEPVRDITFVLENTKTVELPVTGGSGMSTVVIIGTMMTFLGCMYLLLAYRKKKTAREVVR